jgi:hypothetical protein
MKTFRILILLLCALTGTVTAQWTDPSSWTHRGPFRDNTASIYESGRIDVVAPHPAYGTVVSSVLNQDIMVGGANGGLWRTTDNGDNWTNISTNSMRYSGVSDIVYTSAGTDLYVSDRITISSRETRCSGVYKYNIAGGTWSTTGTIAPPTGQLLTINHLKVYPGQDSVVFACTNAGIYRTGNSGTSWSLVEASGEYENIAFVPVSGGYDIYASGQNQFRVSTNKGFTFGSVAGASFTTFDNVYFDMAYADSLGKTIIYLYGPCVKNAGIAPDYDYYSTATPPTKVTALYKFTKTSGGATTCSLVLTMRDSDPTKDRLLCYGTKDFVYVGGDALRKFNFITNKFYIGGSNTETLLTGTGGSGYGGTIHADLHDARLVKNGTTDVLMAATDGGFYRSNYVNATGTYNGVFTNTWLRRNTGMHIAQVAGFSGSEKDTAFYATAEQDTKGFVFNSANMATCKSWGIEPGSALIDDMNDSLILGNYKLGTPDQYYSTDRGASFTYNAAYFEVNTFVSTFEAGTTVVTDRRGVWPNHFWQDQERPGKIYSFERGIFQYDRVHHKFAPKYKTGHFFFSSSNPYLHDDGWCSTGLAMAISPQDENKFYFTSASSDNTDTTGGIPRHVISHIYAYNKLLGSGADINDSWDLHNDDQWELITPDLNTVLSLSPALSSADIYKFDYAGIAVSDWDPNRIWVACTPIPNHPDIKVLQYNAGTWSDYSTGLPADEVFYSMIHERGSNDAIYLSTDRAVYYRDNSMSQWELFDNNLPHVYIRQMEINYTENTLRAGTYGRGIWKSGLKCPWTSNLTISGCANCYSAADFYHEAYTVSVNNSTFTTAKEIFRAVNSVTFLPGSAYTLLQPPSSTDNYYEAFIHGCSSGGNSFKIYNGGDSDIIIDEEEEEEEDQLLVYPNPNNGIFIVALEDDEPSDIYVTDMMGKLVYQKKAVTDQRISIDISKESKGIYFVKVITGDETSTKKIIIQ